ncbi:MAG: glycosyltransferase [Bacteroidales bacterium]|nr:glycosyltransferase [Bacteroidales bacterium]
MKLSVIIINYNVEHFLEQCLISVRNGLKHLEGEIIVADNNSVDGSLEMLKAKFPDVQVIANKKNLGFAKANNQAIKVAKGDFILLLNPDTVVETDTFEKIIRFMESHPDAGGLGVKMVDGSGKFLPESKRGLPTPAAAFYKIFGFAALFPHSKRFSAYYAGHLNENEIHEVDILAGAFMLIRKTVLNKIGLLDESFFMYGEDIDLSYRITKAGYKNYYFPETRILHYKGESTKKSSVNYVLVFYKAMLIFATKHFTGKNARLLTFFIQISIYFRAFLALLARFFDRIMLPVMDFLVIWGGMNWIKAIWARQFTYPQGGSYPETFVRFVMPAYAVIWLGAIFFIGGYEKPYKIRKSILGILSGTVIILVLYALLPENLRFSRGQIVADMIWGLLALSVLRYILNLVGFKDFRTGKKFNKRFIIIGNPEETERVSKILNESVIEPAFIGKVLPSENSPKPAGYIGNILQVKDIINIYKIDEVIFCSKNVSHQTIIDKMAEWKIGKATYKIAPEDSLSIIGSNSINTRGELYTVGLNAVYSNINKRNKRVLDLLFSTAFLFFSPFLVFFMKEKKGFIQNVFSVFIGTKSWVGCKPLDKQPALQNLLKPGVLSPSDGIKNTSIDEETIKKLNILYIRDYSLLRDMNLIFIGFRNLGKR